MFKLPVFLALWCCIAAVDAASLSTDRHRAPPGASIGVTLADFLPGEAVDLYFDDLVQTSLVVDATGQSTTTVGLPAEASPGEHWLAALGRSSGERAQARIRIETRWAQQGYGSDHKAYNPYENQLSAATIDALTPLWSKAVRCRLYGPVAVAYAYVFVGCRVAGLDAGLSAINEPTGGTHWSVVGSVDSQASLAVGNGKVFASAGRRRSLQVFDARTGTLAWSRAVLGDLVASPVISGRKLFVATLSGYLYSLDIDNQHTTYWSRSIGGGLRITAAPAVADGILYVGASNDQMLRAFDAGTGAPLWAEALGGNLPASPVVGNGKVFVTASDGNLYAFDALDGSLRWIVPAGFEAPVEERIAQTPALAQGVLYLGSSQGTLNAIRASDGSSLWVADLGSPMFASPVVANGLVYAAMRDGWLHILDARDGTLLHSRVVDSGNEALNTLVVSNGRVFVTTDRMVHAFGLPGTLIRTSNSRN
jgi:outer membrane protein assembly factor BamB